MNLALLAAKADLIQFVVFVLATIVWGIIHVVRHIKQQQEEQKRRDRIRKVQQSARGESDANDMESFLKSVNEQGTQTQNRPADPPADRPMPPKRTKQKKNQPAKQKPQPQTVSTSMSDRHLHSALETRHQSELSSQFASRDRSSISPARIVEPLVDPLDLARLLIQKEMIVGNMVANEIFGKPVGLRDD